MLRPVALLVTLAAVAVFAACGGDDDSGSSSDPGATDASGATAFPDEQAYFDAMAVAFEDIHAESEAIRTALQEGMASTSEDSRRTAVLTYAEDYIAYGMNAQAALNAVPAPESATEQHAAVVAAAFGLQQLGESLTGAVQLNPPADEAGFNSAYFEIDGSALEQRFRDACVDLETLASSKGIEADYQCTR